MKRYLIILLTLCLISLLPASSAIFAEGADWDLAGGHFYTQTGSGGNGYSVTDESGVSMWSEFKRLGGVQSVGYPVSQRFQWKGYTCQAMQRVVFQWQPTGQVAFANVFDLLHDTGKDEWLLQSKQVPKIADWNGDVGKAWEDVVAGHLALLDANPAIKAVYNNVVGDPIQMNGLPMTPVTDMGNVYVVRCQRVVIQQWKQDMPWAKAGDVTVALGGDIAKEAGLLPDANALNPIATSGATTSAAPTPAPTPAAAPAAAASSNSNAGAMLQKLHALGLPNSQFFSMGSYMGWACELNLNKGDGITVYDLTGSYQVIQSGFTPEQFNLLGKVINVILPQGSAQVVDTAKALKADEVKELQIAGKAVKIINRVSIVDEVVVDQYLDITIAK
jgi:hypothetical protein